MSIKDGVSRKSKTDLFFESFAAITDPYCTCSSNALLRSLIEFWSDAVIGTKHILCSDQFRSFVEMLVEPYLEVD